MGGWGCTTGRSGPDCTVGPRSGRDCAVTRSFDLQGGILSNTGGKDGPGAFREDSGRVWCCWGYRPSLCLYIYIYCFTIFFGPRPKERRQGSNLGLLERGCARLGGETEGETHILRDTFQSQTANPKPPIRGYLNNFGARVSSASPELVWSRPPGGLEVKG